MEEKLLIPNFSSDTELFKFLHENEEVLKGQKLAQMKFADGVSFSPVELRDSFLNSNKSDTDTNIELKNELSVKIVINTTNILDSHKDVHIPGLWNKSLKENNRILHLQEHRSQQFDKIISSGDDLKAYTKQYDWKDLGYNVNGKTEALVFDSLVRKNRNEQMFKEYAAKRVTNHSVGMRYVKIVMCVNSEDYGAKYEAFQKYKEYIVNKDAIGKYFWAVLEAKVIEGSAVPLGSNPITPTLETKNQLQLNTIKQKADLMKWLQS